MTPFDNALALRQMTSAFLELGSRPPAITDQTWPKPKLLALGGDHSIALAALRALYRIYQQPIAVLHFDAHLDTWHPAKYPSAWTSAQSDFTHGSMFWIASNEGLILNGSSAHAGLRTRLSGDGWDDFADDERQGFLRIVADDVDEIGTSGIVSSILERIGTEVPVYLSLDIDVLDPGLVSIYLPTHDLTSYPRWLIPREVSWYRYPRTRRLDKPRGYQNSPRARSPECCWSRYRRGGAGL